LERSYHSILGALNFPPPGEAEQAGSRPLFYPKFLPRTRKFGHPAPGAKAGGLFSGFARSSPPELRCGIAPRFSGVIPIRGIIYVIDLFAGESLMIFGSLVLSGVKPIAATEITEFTEKNH
jgi:hypothetical protein